MKTRLPAAGAVKQNLLGRAIFLNSIDMLRGLDIPVEPCAQAPGLDCLASPGACTRGSPELRLASLAKWSSGARALVPAGAALYQGSQPGKLKTRPEKLGPCSSKRYVISLKPEGSIYEVSGSKAHTLNGC